MPSTRLSGLLATIVALLIAVVSGTALYTSVRFADAEAGARAAGQEALSYSRALSRLKDAVLDAETGQRGYLLTGDPDYLVPYSNAKAMIAPDMREGWALEALRDGQDEELRQLVDFKLSELEQTITLFDSGNPRAALSVVQTDRGREVMAEIRAAVRERQDEAQARADAADARTEAYSARSEVVSNLLFALLVLAAIMGGVTLWLWARSSQAEIEAEEAVDTAERIEVIATELNHRMKNMFAVAQGMLRQSARGRGEAVETYASEAAARLTAMAQAYSVTPNIDARRSLSTGQVIDTVVRGQILDGHGFERTGPCRDLTEDDITPLALILHEWTTNSLKYGAWSPDRTAGDADGDALSRVVITTRETEDGKLELVWDEQYSRPGEPAPKQGGYGTKLVKACALQVGGKIKTEWHEGGVRFRLTADPARV